MKASLLILATCLVVVPVQAQYGGGTGEPDDPHLIYTAEQMNAIGTEPNDWSKHFRLMKDTGQWQEMARDGCSDPDDFYVALQDSSGRIAVAVHPDPTAVNVSSWTQWQIPLSQFTTAGVNVSAVKRMYISVGDRNNPQPNGWGTIYIEDIQLTKRTP
jgi:hypothetical protein